MKKNLQSQKRQPQLRRGKEYFLTAHYIDIASWHLPPQETALI